MAPRVSILLPTHNRADVLGFAIRSVLWQTEPDFELLIVGDGCDEDTRHVVAGFADARIRWFDLPKAPLSGYANRNIALRAAAGRHVAYAQDDDIWFPDHVEKLLAALAASGAQWCHGHPLWVKPDGTMVPCAVDLTRDNDLDHFLKVENLIPSTFVMHDRAALDRVGYWPEDVATQADWVCWQRIIATSASHAVGHCVMPTALHFRAAARRDGRGLERMLGQVIDRDWWPPSCRVAVEAGMSEQQCFFETLSRNPTAWVDALRSSIGAVAERLAWASTVTSEHDLRLLQRRWNSRSALLRQLARTMLHKR